MAWDPIDSAQLNPGFPVLPHMRKANNSLLWLYGQIGTLQSTGIQNGSFEIDSNLDGLPDNWTFSAYPGGSGAISSASPAHGNYAMGMTHPGGAGNGGGYLDSDYNLCTELLTQYIGFIHWASAAGMHNQVVVRYYDKTKAYLSDVTLYDSTSNPTSAHYFVMNFTPPASARFFKVRLIGGNSDTDVAGTAYFDGLQPAGMELLSGRSQTSGIAASNDYSGSWGDIGSMTLPVWLCNLPYTIVFTGTKNGLGLRFKSGAIYSNEWTDVVGAWTDHAFTMTIPAGTTTGSITITMQAKSADGRVDGFPITITKQ